MRGRFLAGIAGLGLLLAVTVAPVAAADHSSLGTPGDPNCVGQTTAAIAQAGKNQDVDGVRGVAGFADASGYASVKDLKAAIEAYCNS